MNNDIYGINVQTDEPAPTRRQRRKARKARWKQHKKDKRAALKNEWKDAPPLRRVFRLYLRKPLIWLLVLAVLAVGGFFMMMSSDSFWSFYVGKIMEKGQEPVEHELILAQAPLDEEGLKRTQAVPGFSKDDTWTFCVYIVGSNLEDNNENDLSGVTRYQTEPIKADNEQQQEQAAYDRFTGFIDEVSRQGMTLPNYLYYVEKPTAYSYNLTEEVIVSDELGCASADILEMKAAELPDNINFVIQTGGATRWSNGLVNPNKTQRFELKNGRLNEVSNLPLQDSCSPDTLAQFLRFCDSEYPADHRVLIMWDHGGGAFGYGHDSIFGTDMTVNDLRAALSAVCAPDEQNPHYEVIGFDACLMASLEVTHALDGFGRYLAASEELEPGDGWDYTTWLNEFAEDTSVSGAELSRMIADSYIDYYIRQNINVGDMIGETAVTFSVTDIAKANEAYRRYADFAAEALRGVIADQGGLTTLGRAAGRSVRFAENFYKVCNTIDLGMFMDNMIEYCPEQSSAVRDAVREAVLYHRENSYLDDATGLSVYMPVQVEGMGGLEKFLDYLDVVCDSSDIKALYYYKLAGCLNEELAGYASAQGLGEAEKLDLSAIQRLPAVTPVIDGRSASVDVIDMEDLIQSYEFSLVKYDRDNDTMIYLGRDNYAYLDGDGRLVSDFDGSWVALDGVYLALEVIEDTPSGVKYRSDILHNGQTAKLLFAYDKDSEEFTILGVKDFSLDTAADVIDRSISELLPHDKIVPVYRYNEPHSGDSGSVYGKTVRFSKSSSIEMKPLENGEYLASFAVTDPRGDEYYSNLIDFTMEGGEPQNLSLSADFTVIASK